MQVFRAAPPENVCKLLSPKDQTRLTVEDVYQMFFTDHRVEIDKKEHRMNIVNEDKNDNISQDQEVAAFRPQQQCFQQQGLGFRNNQQKGRTNTGNKGCFQKGKSAAQPSTWQLR